MVSRFSIFPKVAERAPETTELIAQLDREHAMGEANVRQLQHLLLAWELPLIQPDDVLSGA